MRRVAKPAGLALRATALAALALAIGGCAEPDPPEPRGPDRAALDLFDLSRVEEPTAEQLAGCFAILPEDAQLAALLDALSALSGAATPRVAGIEPLEGLDLTMVDITAELAGGGAAAYSVQVGQREDGSWAVHWFGGPGVEWPSQPRGRGESLSTSPPPTDGG